MFLLRSRSHGPSDVILVTKTFASQNLLKSHVSCLFLPVISEYRVKKCRRKDVHACSNVADLNTGVSLHSSPVLKESA